MLPTLEVRWFFVGAVPPDVLAWFQQGENRPAEPFRRVDRYLRLSQGDSLGIKLREGRLEVKQRQRQFGLVRLHEQVAGIQEHWRKWSFALTGSNGAHPGVELTASSWDDVHKERKLSRYRIAGDRELIAMSPTQYPSHGCDLELTKVRAAGEVWWTLSFEAFGDESTLQENLSLATDKILGIADPPMLEVESSYGYPRWLQILAQRKEA